MTDTDLFTAGESTDDNRLSNAVTTDTPDVKANASAGSLTTMVLPELRALANQAGVKGTSGMRKNELIAAIQEIRGQANGASAAGAQEGGGKSDTATAEAPAAQAQGEQPRGERNGSTTEAPRRERRGTSREAGSATRTAGEADREGSGAREGAANGRPEGQQDTKTDERGQEAGDQQSSGQQQPRGSNQQDDDGDGRQGRRGRRFRDRRRRGERSGDGTDAELREDDVVQPVAGILDVLDNYAFVRTSGYLAGPHDVYVSMNMVRKNGLRRGDAVTGAVRVPRDGEQPNQRQKFNPLVRLDTVNGGSVDDAKKRPEFGKLTPLYPNQRLRLETTTDRLTTRVIDLIMPIGKGQRALIVSPPKAGKTTILQDIANAITKNNPECHLMVVLVDERPEEVTDMQRSVKGEVIASTFDRPPSDHTSVAELAIERAKRLVEQGKDVVVLLDSITRLGRAYNNASPASGRILSGGVDSTALYPPKRFLGAARNIEEGGSLTIIATAMVETGSTGDTVIFEEFKGTGNAELKLDRKIAERRVFPAVDVNPSGTRKDELLLSPDEFAIVHKLRRVLSGLDSHQAIDLLMSQLRKTKNNYEFLVQVSKNTPGADND
ncbi:transcription termination factor Rho [Mycobacterium malmoense]|uniref:Transcription termination factor Rho n=1 Tax=Mycobacterium malmoense TaxID=1780 RepID=A0ABX3SPF7_MYCMA|nr:transcription termination factor Rho [Mycobacterium malmoense]OIN82286.1 transcription termination factor Rho [Mycobacterium malmoense]ORA80675.1 transcription termination factor Rho [Mycobacterium malmoense]QZA16469.1 transcription termination factor Rho [Mycobacterium malmoense]UNB93270.1 transcription termination factor Rho [Mycobacterium malmoense]